MTDYFADYEQWLRGGLKPKAETTIHDYLGILRRMDAELPAGLVVATTDELRDWIYGPGHGNAAHCLYSAAARSWGIFATRPATRDWPGPLVDENAAAALPGVAAAPAGEVVPITEDELAEVLEHAETPYLDLYVLAAFCGMRCIEISRARGEHISAEGVRLFGKGSKYRTVPVHPLIEQRYAGRTGHLALDHDGRPLSADQVSGWGNKYLRRRFGMEKSMHSFRKRFATMAHEAADHDLIIVQDLLGHRFVSTTQKYVRVNQKRKAAAVAALPIPGR